MSGIAQSLDSTTAGGHTEQATAEQLGFIPIPLRDVPPSAFAGIAVYLRREEDKPGEEPFVLYRKADVPFEDNDRKRLARGGVRVVFIRNADHARFRKQTESLLGEIVGDATRSLSEKAKVLYDSGIQVLEDVLAGGDLAPHAERFENISRAVTSLVLANHDSFTQFFATADHDARTVNHMINVGTWIVPLAHALGYRDPEDLARICQAGMLHDVGKLFLPPELLNKREPLTDEENKRFQQHSVLGFEHLMRQPDVPRVAREVCRQHHERMDGSGYPDGLVGERINRIARICAVVDAFDSMTSPQPYRERPLDVSDAILELKASTPAQFDPDIVKAWIQLIARISDRDLGVKTWSSGEAPTGEAANRQHKRYPCDCAAQVHVMVKGVGDQWHPNPPVMARVRDVSRFGLGITSPQAIDKGQRIRVRLCGFGRSGRGEKVVEGQVVRCAEGEGGQFDVGVALFPATSMK